MLFNWMSPQIVWLGEMVSISKCTLNMKPPKTYCAFNMILEMVFFFRLFGMFCTLATTSSSPHAAGDLIEQRHHDHRRPHNHHQVHFGFSWFYTHNTFQ